MFKQHYDLSGWSKWGKWTAVFINWWNDIRHTVPLGLKAYSTVLLIRVCFHQNTSWRFPFSQQYWFGGVGFDNLLRAPVVSQLCVFLISVLPCRQTDILPLHRDAWLVSQVADFIMKRIQTLVTWGAENSWHCGLTEELSYYKSAGIKCQSLKWGPQYSW